MSVINNVVFISSPYKSIFLLSVYCLEAKQCTFRSQKKYRLVYACVSLTLIIFASLNHCKMTTKNCATRSKK